MYQGNVIDPLDIITGIELEALHAKLKVGNLQDNEIERATKYQKSAFPSGIPECGADALRFTLLSYTTGGGDINFDIKVMHAYRRFCNKVWQASKYALGRLPEGFAPVASLDTSKLSLPERWILHRMNSACKAVDEALTAREFSRSTKILYQFFYDELCDVFIENSKAILSDGAPEEQASVQQTLYHTLDVALRLLHPFMPFISEELWQRFPKRQGDVPQTIMLASYPTFDPALEFEADAAKYELGLKCTEGIRSLIAEFNIRSNGKAFVKASTAASYESIEPQTSAIKALSGKAVTDLKIFGPDTPDASLPGGCAIFVVASDIIVMVDVAAGVTDINVEIGKLQKKLEKTQTTIQKQQELMAREGFEENVSDVVLSAEKQKLVDAESATQNYKRTIEEFEKMSLGSGSA